MHTNSFPASTVFFNDLYRFSAAANTWTALSPSGSGPSPRSDMGFAATPDGMLYVFGGYDGGNVGEGGAAYTLHVHVHIMYIHTRARYTLYAYAHVCARACICGVHECALLYTPLACLLASTCSQLCSARYIPPPP